MAKIYLSFLGNTNYGECTYTFGEQKVEDIRFVQEATIQLFASGFDQYIFFLTEDAEKKNWVDNGHSTREGILIEQQGLASRLQLLGIEKAVKTVQNIPVGNNDDEIWQLFEIVYQQLQEEDELVLDMTHALRYIPMLVMTLIQYAKFLKKVKVLGIYHGIYDPMVKPAVFPLLNLAPFSELQDWAAAAFSFTQTGSTSEISKLAKSESDKLNRNPETRTSQSAELGRLSKRLEKLNEVFATNRGLEIKEGKVFSDVKESLDSISSNANPVFKKPIYPILEQISAKTTHFNNQDTPNWISSVKWCLENNLIQQGLTQLQEGLITQLCSDNKLDFSNKDHRSLINQTFSILDKNTEQADWKSPANENIEIINTFLNMDIFINLKNLFQVLADFRNDINHSGYKSNANSSDKFKQKLVEIYGQITNQFQQ
jgi:CRISPR-associated Csx2 family protein